MDWSKAFVPVDEVPVFATETVPVTDVKPGDWVINTNSALVPFYRLVIPNPRRSYNPTAKAELTFHEDRWIGGPDKRRPGKLGNWATIPNGGNGIAWGYEGATIERVLGIPDGIHLMYPLYLSRGSHGDLDKLVDGRIVWDKAKHVHSSGDSMIRIAHEDEFTRVPPGCIALVRRSHRD